MARSARASAPGRVRGRFGGSPAAGNSNQSATWPGDKRLGAPGRVRPPAREDALAPSQDAPRQVYLHHKPSGTIVAGVHPRSNAALCCAGLMAGKTHAFPNRAPPWPGIKRVSAPGRVRLPAREDALAPSQDAPRQVYLHHKPRGTIVAGVHPRSGAPLWCTDLMAGKTRETPNRAQPGPESSALARRAASDLPLGRAPLHRPKARNVTVLCPINQEVQSPLASTRGRTRPFVARV